MLAMPSPPMALLTVFTDTGAGKLAAKGVIISAEGTGAGIQNDANNTDITLNDVTINANDGPGIRTSVALNMKRWPE